MVIIMNPNSFLVVSTEVLPEVFGKVLEVKKLLACGEEKSSASACKRVGISRSAYYKYRECVFTYEEKLTQRIISLYAVLRDKPGVLSAFLSEIHRFGANILTLNQNIPVDGAAAVTVTAKLHGSASEAYFLADKLKTLGGVVDVRVLSGE